jgi:hypothetical protein
MRAWAPPLAAGPVDHPGWRLVGILVGLYLLYVAIRYMFGGKRKKKK